MTAKAWNEPVGGTPRGTLVVLPGRGETAASYGRFGARMSADAYRVRLATVDLDDLDATRAEIEKLLADESLPDPKVLVGADSGATLAATLLDEVAADAAVIVGLALPDSVGVDGWDAEVDARTACPVHRKVIGEDADFGRGALSDPLPWTSTAIPASEKPVLALHGTADPVTPAASAAASYAGARNARVRLVDGGRHDVLNDLSHRSVAATIVLFLESLRLGPDLPDVVSASLKGQDA
ncbi:alpha/beta hydrolase [Solicola gregarius]|uniref:Alpha/beta hydrolase n=1 Tax=Solicola gregarius TaxID=2908642 RepID=A0AA46TME4_9ACTN|nr:alpha/beta hydrolase [Solicola gregarius]UYM07745.1 alpha/beta hydrolase [Solicola gregarius]